MCNSQETMVSVEIGLELEPDPSKSTYFIGKTRKFGIDSDILYN
jgi:hypothetical protein